MLLLNSLKEQCEAIIFGAVVHMDAYLCRLVEANQPALYSILESFSHILVNGIKIFYSRGWSTFTVYHCLCCEITKLVAFIRELLAENMQSSAKINTQFKIMRCNFWSLHNSNVDLSAVTCRQLTCKTMLCVLVALSHIFFSFCKISSNDFPTRKSGRSFSILIWS